MGSYIELDLDRWFADTADTSYNVASEYGYGGCANGYHTWQWYVGFHMDQYWFCTKCDEKDRKKPPPPPPVPKSDPIKR